MLCERCQSETSSRIEFADLTVDIGGALAKRGGRAIHLTPIEFRILEFLIARPGRLIPRRQLWMEIYGADLSETSNALNVALYSMRRKLGKPELIHTLWGRGIVLREPPPPERRSHDDAVERETAVLHEMELADLEREREREWEREQQRSLDDDPWRRYDNPQR